MTTQDALNLVKTKFLQPFGDEYVSPINEMFIVLSVPAGLILIWVNFWIGMALITYGNIIALLIRIYWLFANNDKTKPV